MTKPKRPLTAKREAFCLEYLKDKNATQAAIRAGYSPRTAMEQGCQLLKETSVSHRVQQLLDQQAKRVLVESDDILRELNRLGYSDIRLIYNADGTIKHPTEWPEDLARAVSSIEVEELFEGHGAERTWIGYTKKVKFWPKTTALDLLGKHKKLFTDRVEHTGTISLEVLVAGSAKEEKEIESESADLLEGPGDDA